ncbi:hypothetical protein BCR43DRAFT_526314 [Syncephalastrum racemosum]|uniref:RRM domain-containing protein n=1 Tax=Syncephalastrum racemosum TaxID=13706 RepID=A0A1X2H5Z2_SYNRA|nr:hypothetical protein BCR43DRAFT_526314 [Syncephalastrum racemosum]
MDTQLDLSLDELIKKRRQSGKDKTSPRTKDSQKQLAKKKVKPSRQQEENKSSRGRGDRGGRNGGGRPEPKSGRFNQKHLRTEKHRNHILPKRTPTIAKPSQRQSNTISSRLSSKAGTALAHVSSKPVGPIISSDVTPKKVDPASIIITKTVKRNQKQRPYHDPMEIETPPVKQVERGYSRSTEPSGLQPVIRERGLAIRSAAYSAGPQYNQQLPHHGNGLNIRGESGPATVVISNLDPRANADDIQMICSQFGQVNHCDVLVDRNGVSFGEAEVEFALKSSAMDCIRRLDHEIADGRILRVTLRHTPASLISSPSGYMSQQVRSVITPPRSGFTSA